MRGVPQAFVAAWEKHDGHELAKIMANDVYFVNVGDDWLHGRKDFELYHSRLLSGIFKQSSLKVLDTAVSFLRPDIAVVRWTWRVTGDGEEDPVTHQPWQGISRMIVKKQGGVWLAKVSQTQTR